VSIRPPTAPPDDAFIDPGLQRGDLLLMNMYLWHRASGNTSDRHRAGLFNKYAAASAPPATGYFLYDDEVFDALSEGGRRLLAVHSNRPIATTRAVLTRQGSGGTEVLVVDSDGFMLPGGECWDERAIPDWDLGNHIAPLKQHLVERIGIDPPWVSYAGDFEEDGHLCRVYGYSLNGRGFPVPYAGARWLPVAELSSDNGRWGYERAAVDAWLDPAPQRGKGLTQAQSRIDQYAY